MSKVIAIMSMSLDGYVADLHDGVAEVFDWYFTSGDVAFPAAGAGSFRPCRAAGSRKSWARIEGRPGAGGGHPQRAGAMGALGGGNASPRRVHSGRRDARVPAR